MGYMDMDMSKYIDPLLHTVKAMAISEITGDFYGIIHSINGVISTYNW
jgi:hypothetical protein